MKTSKNIEIEELKDIDIGRDENNLQEFDHEVSNYLGNSMDDEDEKYQKFCKSDNNFAKSYSTSTNHEMNYEKNYDYSNKLDSYAKFNPNYDKFYSGSALNIEDKIFKLEEDIPKINFQNKPNEFQFYLDENDKLTRKIEEYQKLNREWEVKVIKIKNILTDLEKRNVEFKEQNEKLKEECEIYQFKLKVANEKEKIHSTNFKNLKDLQIEYETKINELKREYKTKKDDLKIKYEKLEENMNKQLKDQEDEYIEKIEKLEFSLKEEQRETKKVSKECEELNEQIKQSEKLFRTKEEEFSDMIESKDRKLKEFEICIKSISDDANSQINKLTESISEFNEKINSYKNREMQLTQENQNLKNQMKNNNCYFDLIKSDCDKYNTAILSYETRRRSEARLDNSRPKTVELLRNKIKELEEENLNLSRELNLKYEECDALNEEIRSAYGAIRTSESNSLSMLREKDEEVIILNKKINELDVVISKYGENLISIKKSYDKRVYDHQVEIISKNNELNQMQDRYENRIREAN